MNTAAYSVFVNNSPYVNADSASAYSLQAQPDTGFMYSMTKDSTVVLNLQYYTNASQPNQYEQPYPLPALEPLINVNLPLYDLQDSMQAN